MKRTRIKDIAEICGISNSTVARYLNNSGYISKEKASLIEKVINEIGYTPDRNAQSLRGALNESIGCIVPGTFPNAYFSQISMAIEKMVTGEGYQFMTYSHDCSQSSEQKYIQELVSRGVSYIIYISQLADADFSSVKKLGVPVILIKRGSSNENVHKILMDEHMSIEMATRYLIEKKHEKIGYIGLDCSLDSGIENSNIYQDLMKDTFGNDCSLFCDVSYENSTSAGFISASKILSGKNKPTAIYVASDIVACGVMQYLYKNRLRVPDDVSVIGYGDTFSSLLAPKLTTVSYMYEDISAAVVRILQFQGDKTEKQTVMISPRLIERESVIAKG